VGEAKRKKAAGLAVNEIAIDTATKDRVWNAVQRVMEHAGIPPLHSCLYQAAAAKGALKAIGIDAKFSSGAAWWIVGPGRADTITYGLDWRTDRIVSDGGNLHTWVEYSVGNRTVVVDVTFGHLREVARVVSSIDTVPIRFTVAFPKIYWGRPPRTVPVACGPDGSWSYIPVPGLAKQLETEPSLPTIIAGGEFAYRFPDRPLDIIDPQTGRPLRETMARHDFGVDLARYDSPFARTAKPKPQERAGMSDIQKFTSETVHHALEFASTGHIGLANP
jgi:hypothetical protein